MSGEDLEKYETEAQLELYKEYKEVSSLFSHVVETDRRFYLANSVTVTPQASEGGLYFDVKMTDVWVWDIFRKNRFVKAVQVYSVKDVNVEERSDQQDFTMPEVPDYPPSDA
ncbi:MULTISPECIES: DUF2469 family protein [unclassified Rothia (in: high G+C Gram-positive bacteria)]|uniref:DUF2469 family protein n=1 Tax=unclassified Rothia (in: high G+C Gram-positive bacteria) TaxID=2689056 RepID=UPI00195DD586|nr:MULTISPECIES: DUF2469 family protein [unclassified Rothia (in: high G+C Gram-positive bacteria)]MBM7050904.1 DUF2469 family protein [Rothia sp. ZJ1223]QRZ62357.1 DUF2469 family protein [Rothia sp. ZJ932]